MGHIIDVLLMVSLGAMLAALVMSFRNKLKKEGRFHHGNEKACEEKSFEKSEEEIVRIS